MSKNTKRCTCCGQMIPAQMRYCGYCGWDLESGGAPAGEYRDEYRDEAPARPMYVHGAPRPVETSRWVDDDSSRGYDDREDRRHLVPIIISLAAIAVIIALAVFLVIRMNRPANAGEQTQTFEGVHVIGADGEETTPSPTPGGSTPTPAPSPTESSAPEDTSAPRETPDWMDSIVAVNDYVYVNGSGVRLRSGPSTTYEIVTSLANGTRLERTGTVDGWSRVVYNDRECYISDTLISAEPPAETATPAPTATPGEYTVTETDDTVVVRSDANIRSGPGQGYSVLTTVKTGAELHRTGTADGWSRVQVNGTEGFIFDDLITTDASVVAAAAAEENRGTLTVTGAVNIRSGPGTDYSILGKADTGDTLTLVDGSGQWYQIDYNGQTAYVYSQYVTKN